VIRDRRYAAIVALVLAALALAPPAGATLKASLDAGGLALTDSAGTADDVTVSTNKTGIFVAIADHADTLDPVCPLASQKFHGFQCAPSALVRLDTGAGNDKVDASRLTTPLQANVGSGSDVLVAGAGNDIIATTADGVRDVVDCGAGQDTVEGLADPNDDLAADCETAQRSFAGSRLPKAVTVAAPSTMTLAIGRARVPLSFTATLTTAPPKHGKHAKVRTLAHAAVPAATGAVQLRFKLAKLSSGFLSRRPNIRVQVNVTATAADGRHYPLSLHSQAPGPHPRLATLFDNQLRLNLPAKLRHPHAH
jgi:hypothetical protein